MVHVLAYILTVSKCLWGGVSMALLIESPPFVLTLMLHMGRFKHGGSHRRDVPAPQVNVCLYRCKGPSIMINGPCSGNVLRPIYEPLQPAGQHVVMGPH